MHMTHAPKRPTNRLTLTVDPSKARTGLRLGLGTRVLADRRTKRERTRRNRNEAALAGW